MLVPRDSILACTLIWLGWTGLATCAPIEIEDTKLDSIATRQTAFSIPFTLQRPKGMAEEPVEVQLHLSTDRGATWKLSTRVKPEQSKFIFRAPHDGEYWFSIRTVDRLGKLRPEAALEPELKVLVDTVAPRLDLSASRGPAGEIVAHWQAADPDLKPESLKIEYQTSTGGAWEVLATAQPGGAARHTAVNDATWWPKPSGSAVTVRAQVFDRAGNPAVKQVQIVALDRPAAAEAGSAQKSSSGDKPGRGTATSAVSWPADRTDQTLSTSQAAHPDAKPRGEDSDWRISSSGDPQRPFQTTSSQAAGAGATTKNPAGSTGGTQGTEARTVSQSNDVSRANQPLDQSLLPRGERPRMVNSRSFELEYEAEGVGPSGIAKVELWGTRDAGRTWNSFGADDDNRTPLRVSVDGQGIYGFQVVIQNGSGLGGLPPRPGDMPEIWIGVDLTKPAARISGAEIAQGGGELNIRWEASDEMPDSRPVSLLFSDRSGGPWSTIASGLENTGGYVWRLDNRVPDQIFLRLEVRDEAGNIGLFETPDPIAVSRQRPQGRILNVRPVN